MIPEEERRDGETGVALPVDLLAGSSSEHPRRCTFFSPAARLQ
jgi:hypothetical protein